MKSVTVSRFIGFDASVYVESKYASMLYDNGYRLAIRYVRRDSHVNTTPDLSGGSTSLSFQERDELLSVGFKLTVVQFASLSLVPSASTGTQAGVAAANNAKTLGFVPGDIVWCDLEWASVPAGAPTSVIAYVDAWATAVVAQGLVAGLYVGPNCGLTGTQLWQRPKIKAYWKSAAIVPWVDNRGFQMIQGLPITLGATASQNGIEVDQDICCFDNKNELFKCMAA